MDFFGFLYGFLAVFCLGGICLSPVTLRSISRQYTEHLGEFDGPVWFERMILLIALVGMFALVGILVSVSHGSSRASALGMGFGTLWDIVVRLARWRAQRTPLGASDVSESGDSVDTPADVSTDNSEE